MNVLTHDSGFFQRPVELKLMRVSLEHYQVVVGVGLMGVRSSIMDQGWDEFVCQLQVT
jgi:hypothetical protein